MPDVRISVSKVAITLTMPVGTPEEVIPKFCIKQRKADTYCCSIRHLPEVLALYRDKPIINFPLSIQQLYADEMWRREFSEAYKHGEIPTVDSPTELWEHQKRGVALARVNSRYAFFYDTRTGKTRMAYQIILEAIRNHRTQRAIVFVPSSIIPDWLSDAKEFPELSVVAYYKDEATKQQAATSLASNTANVLIMSVELAVRSADFTSKWNFNMGFFDESSKLKSHKTQISKYMLKYAWTLQYFYLLSATPAPNGYQEYYVQMRCIDPCIFPAARYAFVDKYFNNYSRNTNYEKLAIKPECKAEFEALINEYAIYVDQKVMPVSQKKYIPLKYTLPSESRVFYDKMCKDMTVQLDGKDITVDMATSIRAKLQQIASGFIIDTEAIKQNEQAKYLPDIPHLATIHRIPGAAAAMRLGMVQAVFEENGWHEKYVIWANYHQEFNDLAAWLFAHNIHYGLLNGEVSVADKEAIVESFKHGTTQVILCHPLSVGMGKNFTESHIAIYYSLTDSWEAFKQSCERIAGHIAIQPLDCLYYILLAEDTVNELVYDNIMNKRETSYGILQHLQSRDAAMHKLEAKDGR